MASSVEFDMLSDVLRREIPLDSIKSGIKTIYMTLDPACNPKSPWRICSCYYEEITGNQVIVQLETKTFETLDKSSISSWIESTVNSLRNIHPSFEQSCVVFSSCSGPEYVNAQIYEFLEELLRLEKLGKFFIPCNTSFFTPGIIWTTDRQRQARELFYFNIKTIKIFFSSYFDASPKNLEYDAALKTLLVSKTPEEHHQAFRDNLFTYVLSSNAYLHFCYQKIIRNEYNE